MQHHTCSHLRSSTGSPRVRATVRRGFLHHRFVACVLLWSSDRRWSASSSDSGRRLRDSCALSSFRSRARITCTEGAAALRCWTLGALALFGCNSILGIDAATKVCEPCPEGRVCEQDTCSSTLPLAGADGGTSGPGPAPDEAPSGSSQRCDQPAISYCVGKRRVVCGEDGLETSSTECASQAHCEQATGDQACATCIPTCQGTRLSACQDGVPVPERDCGTDLCDTRGGGDCLSAACTPNQSACADRQFLRCDSGGTFTAVETCASAALCTPEGCRPPVCDVGEKLCTGSTLSLCSEDRTGFVAIAQCATEGLCDQQAGVCQPPVCAADDVSCAGATLRICNADRTGYVDQPCGSPQLCDAVAGVCQLDTCTVGAGHCEGNVLFQCSGSPARFERVDACDSAALCDPAGAQCLTCLPNTSRCSDDGRAAIQCDASGQVETPTGCAALGLLGRCVNGACSVL